MAALPSFTDYATQAADPHSYGQLDDDWAVAVADVVASTQLAQQGRDRDVNFVAGAVVAALRADCDVPGQPAASQFGGDGAVVAVPPHARQAAQHTLQALAHWADAEMNIPLRVGLVPVGELKRAGYDVLVALSDFGNGNVFGHFLGAGIAMAEHWVKSDPIWRLEPKAGPLRGLEGLSCRWRPVPPRRGRILCVIIDPARPGPDGLAALARTQGALETIVPTSRAAPLGDGDHLVPALVPSLHALAVEMRTIRWWRRPWRLVRAMVGSAILGLVHRLGGNIAGVDTDRYRHRMAERCDYRKQAGGPRLVLDVTDDEVRRIEELLTAAEQRGDVWFGLAHSDATTVTCVVGDFQSDRHVHFVDGAGLGFWRASVILKSKRT